MSIAQLRKKAKLAVLEGKYKKALEYYEALHKADSADLRVHVKLAEMREKTGDTKGAIRDYLVIANAYAEEGFVVQAIAINKIILRLDPSKTQVKDRLKSLSSERGENWAISTFRGKATPDGGLLRAKISDSDLAKLSFERMPLFSGLSGKELEAFMDSLQLQHIAADEFIYREGESGSYMYIIGMGIARLETKDPSGNRKVYSQLVEGDFFGEYAFMSRSKHQESAIAESDCSILKISRDTFDEWVSQYPTIKNSVEEFYRQRVLARVIAITPVFEGVPTEARMALANRFHLKVYESGQVVIREGEQGDTFYLIRSGKVTVSTGNINASGDPVVLGSMSDGDFFGEVALLTSKPRTATIVADGTLELMELSRGDFNEIVRNYPSVLKIVEAYQKQRVKDTIRTLMSHKPA